MRFETTHGLDVVSLGSVSLSTGKKSGSLLLSGVDVSHDSVELKLQTRKGRKRRRSASALSAWKDSKERRVDEPARSEVPGRYPRGRGLRR